MGRREEAESYDIVPREKMGFESLGVQREKETDTFKHAHYPSIHFTRANTHPPPHQICIWYTRTHTHANTHWTLIRLKAFQPHGDVTAQR